MSLIQQNAGGSATDSSGSATVTSSAAGFSNPTIPGNFLLLIAWATATGSTSSNPLISNPVTPGFTWTRVATQTNGVITFAPAVGMWYIPNAPSMATSMHTTISIAGNSGHSTTQAVEFSLYEFSGVALTSPVDTFVTPANPAGTSTPHSALVTTATDMLVFAYTGGTLGSNLSSGAGYTLGVNSTVAVTGQMEYVISLSAGTNAFTFVGGTKVRWAGVAAAFKLIIAPPTPTILSISPTSGPFAGGTFCTITGTNFVSGATVTFGGNAATGVVVVSGTEITCVTPVGFPGTVDVVVSESAGTATLHHGYTYVASKILLTMNFQDAGGNPLSYGTVTFTLNTDAVTITGQQINAGRVVSFTLDVNGNLSGPLWPTDQMTADSISPNTTYRVKAYTDNGQLCFEQDMVIPT